MMKLIVLKTKSIYFLGLRKSTTKEISQTICDAYNDNKKKALVLFGRENVLNAHSNILNYKQIILTNNAEGAECAEEL